MDNAIIVSSLDEKKQNDARGNEFWVARELQTILGYGDWRNFLAVIERARTSCETLGVDPSNQFVAVTKKVTVGSGAQVEVEDFLLSRYAAYLVAMNGDVRKPQIAVAQSYFAVQTIRQEQQDQLTDDEKRIQLRERVKDANKKLNSAAKSAGVQNYAYFHDAGYRGLYSIGLGEIKRRKGLGATEDLLDRAGRTELAANEFRITQTEERLVRDRVKGQENAERTHLEVGKKVRKAIAEIGGTMPENLPPETPIKQLRAAKKKAKKLPPK